MSLITLVSIIVLFVSVHAGFENNGTNLIIPKSFGLFNQYDVLQSSSSCGAVMSTYNGVSAKSNGGDQGTGECCGGSVSTGCAYQCVELTQRYFNTKYGTTANWYTLFNYYYYYFCSSHVSTFIFSSSYSSWFWGKRHVNAIDMCASHPSSVSKTSSPKAGDGL